MSDYAGHLPLPKGYATAAIHHEQDPEQWDSMAVVAPLVTSTTFKQTGPAEFKKYKYGRSKNPTRDVLESVLAKLDNGKYGLCFASGMGAQTAMLGLLKSGEHVIVGQDIYGGTYNLFNKIVTQFGIEVSFVDFTSLENFENAIKPKTKLVWIESPSNPTLKVTDIKLTAAIAKKNNIILAVDNTFLTSYLQRPLELGADLVVYSLTKYMNGHTDVTMGAIVTNDENLFKELEFLQYSMGIVPSPFDCYQVNRGLKTLSLRMKQHGKNSLEVAKFLEKHPKIEKVIHPGLPSHPQYEISKKQTSGHSGMVAIYLKGGLKKCKTFSHSLNIGTAAASLGGYETLAEIPTLTSHVFLPENLKNQINVTENLVRMSIGLEDIEDIIADLKEALEKL